MTTAQTPESWVLIKPGYNYLALPASLALEVINKMKLVEEEYKSGSGNHMFISEKVVDMKVLTQDQMTVMEVKTKVLKSQVPNETCA